MEWEGEEEWEGGEEGKSNPHVHECNWDLGCCGSLYLISG